jgi:predicted N-formylglutamate amidohydrolase
VSEATNIPGNRDIDEAAREAREEAILRPYHRAIAAAIRRRQAAGWRTVLVSLHSFTPVYEGTKRPWQAAVLHGEQAAYALDVLSVLQAEPDLVVGDNEPYSLTALSDYTVPQHAWSQGLDHVELEIRQDLIGKPAGQAEWAARIARLLQTAEARRMST